MKKKATFFFFMIIGTFWVILGISEATEGEGSSLTKSDPVRSISEKSVGSRAEEAVDAVSVESEQPSEEKVAVTASSGPKPGVASQTISQGSKPLIKKTAINSPQTKNQRLALACMVDSTSALIIALSMLETTSNKHKPATIIMMENKSIIN